MTYGEYITKLREEAAHKFANYLRAETELLDQGNGFIDKEFIDQYKNAYSEWQTSQNTFNEVLSFLIKIDIDWNNEIGI